MTAATYSPSSVTHTEFTYTSNTITVVNTASDQYKINSVSYTTSNGITFDDLQITFNNNTWQYTSNFENAVNRFVKYIILADDHKSISDHSVNNLKFLPEIYDNLYYSAIPDESMTVTFHIVGETRSYSETSSGDSSGSSSGVWSAWTPWSDDFTITIETNLNKHVELIQKACNNQRFVRNINTNKS